MNDCKLKPYYKIISGIEFYIGLPRECHHKVARLSTVAPSVSDIVDSYRTWFVELLSPRSRTSIFKEFMAKPNPIFFGLVVSKNLMVFFYVINLKVKIRKNVNIRKLHADVQSISNVYNLVLNTVKRKRHAIYCFF